MDEKERFEFEKAMREHGDYNLHRDENGEYTFTPAALGLHMWQAARCAPSDDLKTIEKVAAAFEEGKRVAVEQMKAICIDDPITVRRAQPTLVALEQDVFAWHLIGSDEVFLASVFDPDMEHIGHWQPLYRMQFVPVAGEAKK